MTKKQEIKKLRDQLNKIKKQYIASYVRHRIKLTPADVEAQKKMSEITTKIIILEHGK